MPKHVLLQINAMLSECEWQEGLVEMELRVRLAELALKEKEYNLVCFIDSSPTSDPAHCE